MTPPKSARDLNYCAEHLIDTAKKLREVAPRGSWHYETLEDGAKCLRQYLELLEQARRLREALDKCKRFTVKKTNMTRDVKFESAVAVEAIEAFDEWCKVK